MMESDWVEAAEAEVEVEGHCPFPLFFGLTANCRLGLQHPHHQGTCWKCEFSSSILDLLLGLALTCGAPSYKRVPRW